MTSLIDGAGRYRLAATVLLAIFQVISLTNHRIHVVLWTALKNLQTMWNF